jgi:hypothetical protein
MGCRYTFITELIHDVSLADDLVSKLNEAKENGTINDFGFVPRYHDGKLNAFFVWGWLKNFQSEPIEMIGLFPDTINVIWISDEGRYGLFGENWPITHHIDKTETT